MTHLHGPAYQGKADLHIHSTISDGMMSVREILDWVQERTDLDVIAVTDHDDLEGGLLAREMARTGGYRFEVIPGMEISTRGGHLLALYLEEPVHSMRRLDVTIEDVRERGGLCIVPHPMSWMTTSVGERALDRAMAHHTPGIHGIEVENPTLAGWVVQRKVRRINRLRYGLGETGGSDAHFLPAIGSSYTRFPGKTAEDLRRAILDRTSQGMRPYAAPERVPVRSLIAQQGRSLIWLPAKRVRGSIRRQIAAPRE